MSATTPGGEQKFGRLISNLKSIPDNVDVQIDLVRSYASDVGIGALAVAVLAGQKEAGLDFFKVKSLLIPL